MLRNVKLIIISLIIIILNGCTNISDNKQSQHIDKSNETTNTKTYSEVDTLDFGSKFDVKNLLIQDFSKEVYEDYIIYKLEYILSENTYKFIQDTNLEYYFHIEYPEEIADLVGEEKTEFVKGKNRNDNDICTIEFKQAINVEDVEKIKVEDLNNYNLVVSNKEFYPVTIFNDIITFISIDGSSRFFNID